MCRSSHPSIQPCHPSYNHNHNFYSLPSIPPPLPPPSNTPPNYIPWMPATVPQTTVTTSTHPSIFPIPTPPSPPIQIAHFPSPHPHPPTSPPNFSTLPNQSISTHLMFRVQSLRSSPRNNIPLSSSQINSPHPTHTPTSLTTLFNSTSLQVPINPISVPRVHTRCRHRPNLHHLLLTGPTMTSLLPPSHKRPTRPPLPTRPLLRVALTRHTQGIA
jgi:hypothetical protein